jgi:predicted DNA-binding transcriptional regulator AlpA
MAYNPGDELITVPELKRELKLKSSTTVWDWVKKGLLPRPHHLRQRAVWKRRDIEAAKSRLLTPPPPRAEEAGRA